MSQKGNIWVIFGGSKNVKVVFITSKRKRKNKTSIGNKKGKKEKMEGILI